MKIASAEAALVTGIVPATGGVRLDWDASTPNERHPAHLDLGWLQPPGLVSPFSDWLNPLRLGAWRLWSRRSRRGR